jgi:glycosyltransferase involved in cell wall biosynthesis
MQTDKCVWYISKYAWSYKYGFGTRHFYLSEFFNKKGYKASVFSANYNHITKEGAKVRYLSFTEEIGGVPTLWLKINQYEGASSLSRMLSWVVFELALLLVPEKTKKFGKPDIIIVSSLSLLTILSGYILKKRYNARLIFEVRDIWPLTIIQTGGFSPKNPIVRILGWIERFGYLKSDAIVGTMPNLVAHVNKVLKRDCSSKVYNIPQGIDLYIKAQPQPLEEAFIKNYLPTDRFIVGYAGTIGRTNALDTLISCARIVEHQSPKVVFVLLGDGDYKTALQQQAADLSNVIFAPKISKHQVSAFLEHCHVLYDSVMNVELYHYGVSRNKWTDYFLAAKPLIVSGNFDGKDGVSISGAGELVEPENPEALASMIIKFANYPVTKLIEMGQKGKDYVQKYHSFDYLSDQYIKIFQQIYQYEK